MKIEVRERKIKVEVRRKSWTSAALRIIYNWAYPPNGYKLLKSEISRRSASGRATNLTLTYGYCDSREPMFTEDEAWDFFRKEEGDE